MPSSPTMFDRLNTLPRAGRWMLYAVLAIGGFMAWDSTIRPTIEAWNTQSALIEAKVAQLRAGDELEAQFKRIAPLVEAIGPVEVPVDEEKSKNALNRAVNEVIAKHSVSKVAFESRTSGRLSKGVLAGIDSLAGKRLDRLTGDLEFEADPKNTFAFIAALEARPEIEAVTSIRISKEANSRLKVRMTVEAWVVSQMKEAA